MPRGKYIVLEGDEGSGKTTQLNVLAKRLESQGVAVKTVREPGGDPFAQQLRLMLKGTDYQISPLAQVFAFCAGRANMLELVVKPLIRQGSWVLADRSYLSTYVYQGLGYGLDDSSKTGWDDRPMFRDTVRYGASPVMIDMGIIIDVPLEVSKDRVGQRNEKADRFESEGHEFRRRINSGYRKFGRTAEWQLVDGSGTIAEVHDRIWKHVEPLVGE